MQPSIRYQHPSSPPTNEPTERGSSRLRTVTGNRFPRKCSCGCGQPIPRDPSIRYVVDFGAPRPYPAYLREHSPDYGRFPGPEAPAFTRAPTVAVPGFVPASALVPPPVTAASCSPSEGPSPGPWPAGPARGPSSRPLAHADEEATASPESGRPWASGQLVFNAGSFESCRSAFADYGRADETEAQLRARVHRVILEDLEQKVVALRRLHERLRERLAGPSFGDSVAGGRPRGEE